MSLKARTAQSQLPGSINGTMYGGTSYGDCVPALCGRARVQPKMVWAANHRQAKSGKKLKQSKKKGSQPSYAQNCDFLLASTTLQDIGIIWRNKDIFSLTQANETGTVDGTGRYTLTSCPSGHVVVAILAVLRNGTYNVTISDYQGADPGQNFTGTWQTPMYRLESLVAPVFNAGHTTKFPFPNVYSMSLFHQIQSPQISFPDSSLIGESIEVFFYHADSSKLPLSLLNLIFESTLANQSSVYAPQPSQQLGYNDVAGVGSTALDLGSTDSIPSFGLETTGNYAITPFGECDPADLFQYIMGAGDAPLAGFGNMLTLIDSFFRSTNSTTFLGDLTQLRNFSRASGIFLSRYFDTQQSGRDYLQEVLDATNCEALWSEQVLKLIPRSEVSAFGNGAFYQPDCSFGPKFDFGRNVLISEPGKPAFTIEHVAQIDANNIVPIEHIDAENQYNTAVTTWQDQLDIYQNGAFPDDTKTLHCIYRTTIAQQVASMLCKRNVAASRNVYKFKVPARFGMLEPMDVVTLSDDDFGFKKIAVRLTKTTDNYPGMEVDCEAEDFRYGANQPVGVSQAAVDATAVTTNSPPGNVVDYAIFDLPAKLKTTAQQVELGIALCGGPAWGGAAIYISNDNTNFTLAGTAQGGSTMGKLTASFPSHVDPDNTNTLTIDFSESDGEPISATATTRDQFQSLVALIGSTGQFELVGYATVSLVTGDTYNFSPRLRRGVYGLGPNGFLSGDRATIIDSTIVHIGLQPQFIGVTLYFKFCSFNTYGQEQQSLADVTSVTYTPNGASVPSQSYSISPQNPLSQGTGSGVNTIIVAPFTANFSTGTVSYLGATISIATPTSPTDYWVTIADPGQIGEGGGNPTLTYTANTTATPATAPGNTFAGKITVLPTGGARGSGGGSSGNTSPAPTPGGTGTYEFTDVTVGSAWTGVATNPNNIIDGSSSTFCQLDVTVPTGPSVPTIHSGGPVVSPGVQLAPLGPLSPTSITLNVDFEVTINSTNGTPGPADLPNAITVNWTDGNNVFGIFQAAYGAGAVSRQTISVTVGVQTLVPNIRVNFSASMPWNASSGAVQAKIYGIELVIT